MGVIEISEDRDEKILLCYKETSVFVQYIFEKLFRSSVFIPSKNKINFKNLKLEKPSYHVPTNSIPESFQMNTLPTFTGSTGNSVTIPLTLWESMGCQEMDES